MIINKKDPCLKKTTIGNKAYNLIWLENNGIPTPTFEVIILNDYFQNFGELSKSLLAKFANKDLLGIQNLLENASWNEQALEKDFSKLEYFLNKSVSFRTSALSEDLENQSFAGIYETFLRITFNKDTFRAYLLKCFSSIFSEKLLSYSESQKIEMRHMGLSVIIQEMFPAKISGIAFSEYPSGGRIVFSKGLGKKVVDGNDAYELNIKKNINIDEAPEIKSVNAQKSFLDLLACIEKISYLKGIGQDIEWSVSEEAFAILQTRDITRSLNEDAGEAVFDSTNISESYPGTISPLTYSFIRFVYSKVYANFFRLVGVKEKNIEGKHEVLENLLGYIKGRAYYNIGNWYKMIETLPGYSHNKDFFESMLVPQKKIGSVNIKKTAHLKKTALIFKNIPLIIRFLHKLLFHKRLNSKFLDTFEIKYSAHKKMNLDSMTAKEICAYYAKTTRSFLDDWKVPILNDFRLMISHGILKKIVFRYMGSDSQLYLNEIMAGFSGKDDLESIKSLKEIASHISASKHFSDLFKNDDSRFIYSEIIAKQHNETKTLHEKIFTYMERYGDRRPNELILESPKISDNPEFLITLIKQYLSSKKIRLKHSSAQDIGLLEKSISSTEGIFSGIFLIRAARIVAKYTKISIRYRELFRARRATVFGFARDCFIALDKKFYSAGIIDSTNDIFFMTTEEIICAATNNIFDSRYGEIISKRKLAFSKYQDIKEIPQRLRVIGIGEKAQFIEDSDPVVISNVYKGLPASQGIVRGKAIVLKKFDIDADFRDKILVTYQTDPGWSIIFPLLKGVVVEKGNTLSHAAILSREIGIPSVVKTPGIVNNLMSGQLIEVDGNSGTIKIIKE